MNKIQRGKRVGVLVGVLTKPLFLVMLGFERSESVCSEYVPENRTTCRHRNNHRLKLYILLKRLVGVHGRTESLFHRPFEFLFVEFINGGKMRFYLKI